MYSFEAKTGCIRCKPIRASVIDVFIYMVIYLYVERMLCALQHSHVTVTKYARSQRRLIPVSLSHIRQTIHRIYMHQSITAPGLPPWHPSSPRSLVRCALGSASPESSWMPQKWGRRTSGLDQNRNRAPAASTAECTDVEKRYISVINGWP
jgi:hypothetical protein